MLVWGSVLFCEQAACAFGAAVTILIGRLREELPVPSPKGTGIYIMCTWDLKRKPNTYSLEVSTPSLLGISHKTVGRWGSRYI